MNRRLAEGFKGGEPSTPREPVAAVVALGSNLGDRVEILREAVTDLARLPLVDDVRVADVIESVALTPQGPDAAAPAYLNTVALVTTRLAPSVLLAYLHAIEARHGRERTERWGIGRSTSTSSRTAMCRATPRLCGCPTRVPPNGTSSSRRGSILDPEAELPGLGRVDELLRRLRAAS